jgi:putative ABC transport system ATP-binding protein
MHLIAQAHAAGTTVCLVTHDPRYRGAGTRAVEVADGRTMLRAEAA